MTWGNEELGATEIHALNVKSSDKFLRLLRKHHPEEIKVEVAPAKPEPILCDNCRDPIFRFEGLTRIQDVKRAATHYFALSPHDIDSHRRTGKLSYARQIVMYLSRMRTLKSYPEIASRLGGRDHTCAIHGVRKIEKLVKSDWTVAFDVAHVEAML